VELTLTGTPILSAVCYCDDCQAGARLIEALPQAGRVCDADGGTAYLLYRKDRVRCARGVQHLKDYKIKAASPTSRVVATCCNSGLYLNFSKGHWLSLYRGRFQGEGPPVEMRVCTKFKPEGSVIPDDAPRYAKFPLKFVGKLIAARIAMLLRR
ncbi:MAG: GFA family protein, partial [Alphaproteobacteria bacterium]